MFLRRPIGTGKLDRNVGNFGRQAQYLGLDLEHGGVDNHGAAGA